MTTACARRLRAAVFGGLAGTASMVGGLEAAGAQTQPNACEPRTNNFERTVRGRKLAVGELTVLDDRFVYTGYLAPPSKTKARDAVKKAIDRSHRRPA